MKSLLKAMGLSKSTYYYEIGKTDKVQVRNADISSEITAIFHEHKGRYGVRRIHQELLQRGFRVNHKRVQRIMNQLGLAGKRPKEKYHSYRGEVGKVADNIINRDFSTEKPLEKWTTDVSQFTLPWGKCYISPILDMNTNEIISYNLSLSPNALYDLTDLEEETETITYEVTLPTGEGYTAEAADGSESPVAAGGRYAFTVTLADGYTKDENFAVKVNGVLLTETEGKYTIKNIRADQVVTVEGVRKALENETFTVTLPSGEGYIAQAVDVSGSLVEYGGSYVFTVTIMEGYSKSSTFSVKANGITLTEINGKYTIENITTDQTVTITGVVDTITVSFSLLGCYKHNDGETEVHTLFDGNLQDWINMKEYEVPADSTVKDILEIVLSQNGMTAINPDGNYVKYIVKDGIQIGEFTNGSLSGWMYTLNGTHPNLGVAEQTVENGDVIVFHYTDDYTKEDGSQGNGDEDTDSETAEAAEAVEKRIGELGEITLESEETVKAAREAYEMLTDKQKSLVSNLDVLESAEKKLAELKALADEAVGTPPSETEPSPTEPVDTQENKDDFLWLIIMILMAVLRLL